MIKLTLLPAHKAGDVRPTIVDFVYKAARQAFSFEPFCMPRLPLS